MLILLSIYSNQAYFASCAKKLRIAALPILMFLSIYWQFGSLFIALLASIVELSVEPSSATIIS